MFGKSLLPLFLLFWLPFLTYAQVPQGAQPLNDLNNWCSEEAAFATEALSDELMRGPKVQVPRSFGKWFSFRATSTEIDVRVHSGNDAGTLQFAHLFLVDKAGKPLKDQTYADTYGTVAIFSEELVPGEQYYIGVGCTNKPKYSGSFGLCISNRVSNDFPEGATLLNNLSGWYSAQNAYTTVGATGVGSKPSKMKGGPNYNRWFRFTARASEIDVKVLLSKSKEGGLQFPYLTLWNADLKELHCVQDLYAEEKLSLSYSRLKVGQTYYLSVDHNYIEKYKGTFGLFIDDHLPPETEDEATVVVVGRLQTLKGKGIQQSKIVLLNEKSEVIGTETTDILGKFSFRKLPAEDPFLVRIEEQDTEFYFDVYQTEENGTILAKGREVEKNLYGFQNIPARLSFLPLLRWADVKKLKSENGSFGIVGRLVNPKVPVDGISQRTVYLYRDRNSLVDSTKTDAFGKFWFLNASPNGKNLISIAKGEKAVYAEMLLVNDKSIPVMTATSSNLDQLGFFHFQPLPPMEVSLEPMAEVDELSGSNSFNRLTAGTTVELQEVYFATGKAELLPDSYQELDRLVEALKANPMLRIALHGHTDDTGSESDNQRLSTARAKAVYDYLVSKNITSNRLSYKGHGSTQPVATNKTAEGRKANRRVELKVLK